MSDDKRTKGQILNALHEAEQRADAAEAAAYRVLGSVNDSPPARVPEADAVAACVRALDALVASRRNNPSVGYSAAYAYQGDRQQSDVERVLRLLAARYSVPLIETQTGPCERAHLDDATDSSLVDMLKNRRF